jgi:aspartate aminotransferase
MPIMQPKRRFANRLLQVQESSTAQVFQAVKKLKAQGVPVVDLVAGEPDFDTPDNIKIAAKLAIDSNFTRYTATGGIPQLLDAILARYREDFGVERTREEVIATIGAKQAVFNTLLALVDPGDQVVIPAPYWVTFPQVVRLCGGEPVIVETDPEQGFQITARQLEPYLNERTKALIVNSPHNPTGAVIPSGEFFEICRMAASRGIYVLSDECYQRFLYDGLTPYTAAAVAEAQRPFVIVWGSLSKTYAMTGWRLGYAIGPAELIAQLGRIQGHQTSNPTSISQAAGIEALAGSQDSVLPMIQEYQRRRDFLIPALNRIRGIQCSLPQGAFYAYADVRSLLGGSLRTSDEFAARLLQDMQVAVTPSSGFGAAGFIRISYAAAYNDLEEAVRRLTDFVASI